MTMYGPSAAVPTSYTARMLGWFRAAAARASRANRSTRLGSVTWLAGRIFDRNAPLEARVARTIHLAHAADCHQGDDLVGSEASSLLQ